MTTIIVKGADYSAGPIVGYVPPVPGALLASWVGDTDPEVALRNFGSEADLTLAAAMPIPGVTPGFRRVSSVNYLQTDIIRTESMTFVAVGIATSGGDWKLMISGERDAVSPGTGRRSLTLRMQGSTNNRTMVASGTSSTNDTLSSIDVRAAPRCLIGTAEPGSGAGASVWLHDMTENQSGTKTNSTQATTLPDEHDVHYPFRIGANYVDTSSSCELAFVGIWPFVMSDTQRTLIYNSVKKRLDTRYGVTI